MKTTMKAMILAAGRGERLRPLTDHTPKPLIDIGGQPLIGHHLSALARAGFEEVVINVAYLGEQIVDTLGDGRDWGLRIAYSRETPGELDTGGGIRQALALLGERPFALISADVFTDFDYAGLRRVDDGCAMHAVLVDNPPHHPNGDFGLVDDGRSARLVDTAPRLTYAGVGVYAPRLFARIEQKRFPLVAVMRDALARNQATGAHHRGCWVDVGRPSALETARALADAATASR